MSFFFLKQKPHKPNPFKEFIRERERERERERKLSNNEELENYRIAQIPRKAIKPVQFHLKSWWGRVCVRVCAGAW